MGKIESSVDRVYDHLRQMAVNFEFRPEERINESALSTKLGASRTPLREALNRLVAEGFLTFQNGRGFFCRALSPSRILNLYEARQAIECEAVRRAIERASDAQISTLSVYLDETEPRYDTCQNIPDLLEMDEEFHMRIAMLSGNEELVALLGNLNDRIRYVRLINLQMLRQNHQSMINKDSSLSGHRNIVEAIKMRDTESAIFGMRKHIERHREETTEAVRIAYSQLYMPVD